MCQKIAVGRESYCLWWGGRLGSGGDLASSLGVGRTNFSRTKMTFVFFGKNSRFGGQIPISFLFLVIDQLFRIFSFLFQIFRYLCYIQCRILSPFPHKKNTFLLFHTFAHIRQHYFSKYWGDGCMGRPPPQTLGGPPPAPVGLRPCDWVRSRVQVPRVSQAVHDIHVDGVGHDLD